MLSIRKLVGKAEIDKRCVSVPFLSQYCFQTSLLSAITLSQSCLCVILSTDMPTISNPLLPYCLYRSSIFGNCRRQGLYPLYQKSINVYLLRRNNDEDNFSLFLFWQLIIGNGWPIESSLPIFSLSPKTLPAYPPLSVFENEL